MRITRLRARNQITLPANLAAALGLRAGLHALAAPPPEALREVVGALRKHQSGRFRRAAPDNPSTRS